jgi:hypothetical protein
MKFSAGTTPPRPLSRLFVATLAVTAVAALAACEKLTSVDASFDNTIDSAAVFYTVNNSPAGTATAINLFTGDRYRADETFAYDIAFDLDPAHHVLIIPARALATGLSAPYSVGLQKMTGVSFAQLTDAPKSGYVVDSVLSVTQGSVVAIESHDAARCGFAIKGSSYFSKLVVTAVDTVNRKISTVLVVNRNCGFHSFALGKPKN